MPAPSHASLLTGLTPPRHGVRDNGQALGPGPRTLAEAFRSAGYATGGFVSGFPPDRRFGLARGLDEYHDRLQPFEKEHEVAPGVLVSRTGGHTPGHSVVRVESGRARLMFGGDSVFPPGFECPHWHNGFDQEPEASVLVRVALLRELASTGQPLVPTHVAFPAAGRVAMTQDVFSWVPAYWH